VSPASLTGRLVRASAVATALIVHQPASATPLLRYGSGVRVFDFGAEHGRRVTKHASDFTISRLAHTRGLHVGCMRLGPGGVVGYHRAATHQILAVVEGVGWTRGEGSGRIPVVAGQAVYWQPGEWHETGTDDGLVAIVVEGDALGGEPEAIGPAPPVR